MSDLTRINQLNWFPDKTGEQVRPGYKMVRFPVGYGELKGATLFHGVLVLAFENGIFRMPPGEDAAPVEFTEVAE